MPSLAARMKDAFSDAVILPSYGMTESVRLSASDYLLSHSIAGACLLHRLPQIISLTGQVVRGLPVGPIYQSAIPLTWVDNYLVAQSGLFAYEGSRRSKDMRFLRTSASLLINLWKVGSIRVMWDIWILMGGFWLQSISRTLINFPSFPFSQSFIHHRSLEGNYQ